MKRILIAIMFVVGFSAAAQAKIVYLQCGPVSLALDTRNKKIIAVGDDRYNKIKHFGELYISLGHHKNRDYMSINRLNLKYFADLRVVPDTGTCLMGRKF